MKVLSIRYKSNDGIVENDIMEWYRFAGAVAAFLALLGACCFRWLLNTSDCSCWDYGEFEKFLDACFNMTWAWVYLYSSSLPQKGTSNNSVTHSVLGILKIGSSEVFSNIYVPYGRREYWCHANQPANIYFQQTKCVSPLLILPKAFFILLTFYLCKLIIREQDSNY